MASKIGVFGGTFSPLHFGHINSILTVKEKMNLDKVKVVPAFQAPGRETIEKPSAQERLELVQIGLSDYLGEITVEDCEIERGGVSYSIDTLEELVNENPEDDYYLIIGLDQFKSFDSWKDVSKIFDLAHVIVTSRPGYFFPLNKSEFPERIQDKIVDFDGYMTLLKSGKQIHFVRLEDFDISASDIRKRVRLNQSINKYVPLEVEQYINSKDLYTVTEGVDYNSKDLATRIAQVLKDQEAINVLGYDLRDQNQITDFTLIASAQSKKANASMVDKLIDEIRDSLGVKPLGVEGQGEANWIVVDYGSVMLHSFYEFVRYEYKIEEIWNTYPKLNL